MNPVRDKNPMIFINMFYISDKKSFVTQAANFTSALGGLSLTG